METFAEDAFFASFEQEEDLAYTLMASYAPIEEQEQVDSLLDQEFTWEESLNLLSLRERLYDVPEMAERITTDPHILFARWRYQQGLISEGVASDAPTSLTNPLITVP